MSEQNKDIKDIKKIKDDKYKKYDDELSEEPLFPILPALYQLFNKDLLGNTKHATNYLLNEFDDEVQSIEQMLNITRYTDKIGEIFNFLPLIMDFLPEDKIANIAIAVLVDDKVTEDVSKILSQNLAKGANIFLEEFNQATKEKQEELIQMVKQMTDEAVSSVGSGIAVGLTNAVSDIPPVGAIMGVVSLIRGLVESADRVLRKAEVAEDTVTQIINKSVETYNNKWDNSGGPELVELARLMQELSKKNPQELTSHISSQVSSTFANTAHQKAKDTLSSSIQNQSKHILQKGGKKSPYIKSILKTRKHRNINKKTRKNIDKNNSKQKNVRFNIS